MSVELANSRVPISRYARGDRQGVWLWVGELPSGVEEHRLFGPGVEEAPSGSRLLAEGHDLRQGGIRAKISLFFVAERKRRHNAAKKR